MPEIKPATPGGVPDSPDELGPTAKNNAKKVARMAASLGADSKRAAEIGSHAGGISQAIIDGAAAVISWLVTNLEPLLEVFLATITKVRTQNVQAFNDLSAAVLSEFLGVELTGGHVATGKGVDASLATARNIGNLLLTRLEHEFTGGQAVSPASGETAAKTFAGYGVNFGVQNTIISTLADALSDHLLENIRELGVETARNIGLGRLVRSALRPLVDNTIAKPYDRLLRAKYRQDAISDTQLVKALNRGKLGSDVVHQRFAEKGYPDDQITELIHQLTSHLTDTEVNLLLRYGVIDDTAAVAQLVDEGWPEATARLKLRVLQLQKVDALETQYVNAAEKLCIDEWIGTDEFQHALDTTHYTDAEKEWEQKYVALRREFPRADLTLAQMQAMYAAGIVTLDDWQTFLDHQGYDKGGRPGSLDAQTFLTLEMLKKAADAAAKAAKSKVKLLTVAQLTKAWKGGTITQQQLQDYLAGEGYGAADVFRLMAQIIGSAPTPANVAAATELRAMADAADLAPDVTTSG